MGTGLLVDIIIATTAAAAVGAVAALVLHRAPAMLRNSVWRVALISFWVSPLIVLAGNAANVGTYTVSVHAPTGAPAHIAPAPVTTPASEAAQPGASVAGASGAEATGAGAQPGSGQMKRPSVGGSSRTVSGTSRTGGLRIDPTAMGLAIWAFGLVVGIGYLILGLLALLRLLRAEKALPDPALEERVAHWSARLGLRRVPLMEKRAGVTVPIVVGVRRAVLLVPEGLGPDQPGCDGVLVHELAHIRRSDLSFQLLARLTRVLWWWNPLAWLTVRGLEASAEEACDDWAIALTTDRRAYATLLVSWVGARMVPGASARGWCGRELLGRIKRIRAAKGKPVLGLAWWGRVILVVCALGLLVGIAGVRLGHSNVDKLVFVGTYDGQYGLWVLGPENRTPRLLYLSGEGFEQPAWSPDGTKVAFSLEHSIYITNAGSGSPKLIYKCPKGLEAFWPAWMPDGKTILFCVWPPGVTGSQLAGVWAADTDGGAVRQIMSPSMPALNKALGGPDGVWYWGRLRLSPDGTRIVVDVGRTPDAAKSVTEARSLVCAARLDSVLSPQRATVLAACDSVARPVCWLADSRHVLLSDDGGLYVLDADSGSLVMVTDAGNTVGYDQRSGTVVARCDTGDSGWGRLRLYSLGSGPFDAPRVSAILNGKGKVIPFSGRYQEAQLTLTPGGAELYAVVFEEESEGRNLCRIDRTGIVRMICKSVSEDDFDVWSPSVVAQ